jgi:hypothetical protein
MIKVLHLLLSYEAVIADLKQQEDTYEPNALAETFAKLEHRIWEIKNVWKDELAKDYEQLELSKARHPSNQ